MYFSDIHEQNKISNEWKIVLRPFYKSTRSIDKMKYINTICGLKDAFGMVCVYTTTDKLIFISSTTVCQFIPARCNIWTVGRYVIFNRRSIKLSTNKNNNHSTHTYIYLDIGRQTGNLSPNMTNNKITITPVQLRSAIWSHCWL